MKRWYNYETLFRSLKDELREFLHNHGIEYELSGCGRGWHFEVKCDKTELEKINAFLDDATITAKCMPRVRIVNNNKMRNRGE